MATFVREVALPYYEGGSRVQVNQYINLIDGAVSSDVSNTTPLMLTRFSFKRSSRDDQYTLKLKSGQLLPEHPFKFQQVEYTSYLQWVGRASPPSSSYSQTNTLVSSTSRPEGSLTSYSTPVWLPYNGSAILFRLQKKAKSSQFNAPVFFAEANKTATMVVGVATKMVMTLRALRQGRFGDARDCLANGRLNWRPKSRTINGLAYERATRPPRLNGGLPPLSNREVKALKRDFARDPSKTASNLWLEWSYGWIPFMLDVKSASEVLWELQQRPADTLVRVRATEASETVVTEKFTAELGIPVGQDSFAIYWGNKETVRKQDERQRWALTPNSLDMPGKLGLTNPLEVAWELMPFSFVADWFLPIGDYLSQLDLPIRFNHHSRICGLRQEFVETRKGIAANPGYQGTMNSGFYQSSRKSVTVDRSTDFGLPFVSLGALTLEMGVKGKRTISAIALLRQQLTRLKK